MSTIQSFFFKTLCIMKEAMIYVHSKVVFVLMQLIFHFYGLIARKLYNQNCYHRQHI